MNRYEKLGRGLVAAVIAFIGCYAFSATLMSITNLYSATSPLDTILVCSGVGTFFAIVFFGFGYISEL